MRSPIRMYKYALWQNISEFANRDSSKNYICQLAKNLRIHKLQNTYMLFGRIFANSQTAILAKIKICQLAENLLIHRFHNAYVRGQGGCRCMVGQARAAVRCDAVGRAPRKKSTDKSLGISLIGSQKRAEGRARVAVLSARLTCQKSPTQKKSDIWRHVVACSRGRELTIGPVELRARRSTTQKKTTVGINIIGPDQREHSVFI